MPIPLIDSYVQLIQDNKDFRYLWTSQVISQVGDWFSLIASAGLVARLSGSGLALSGLFVARMLPPFLLGPLVGVVADRFDRRRVLIASDLLRVAVVLGFLLVRTEADLWLLYTLTVLHLSISAFFEPARSALLPGLVRPADLITANVLGSITWSSMLALGAALGGATTATLGLTAAFLIDAATFLASAGFIARVRAPAGDPPPPAPGGDNTGWQVFVEGLAYLWQRPRRLGLALVRASAALAYGGVAVVEVTLAEQVFPLGQDGSATLGLIYLAIGLGTGLGPLVARRITGDRPAAMVRALSVAYLATLAGYALLGWAPSLALVLLATFVRTVGTGINWVYASSLIQMKVPSQFLGRVFAFDFAMLTLASAVSTVWAGWARDDLALGPHAIALSLAGITLLMTAAWAGYLVLGRHWAAHPG